MKSMGLCIGASNISRLVLENAGGQVRVLNAATRSHDGNPREAIKRLLEDEWLKQADYMAVTGRKLRHMLKVSSLSEPEALEYAYRYDADRAAAEGRALPEVIVSAGGETFIAYCMNQQGRIVDVFAGNKCASGTGEFFLQQLKRMNLGIEEAVAAASVAAASAGAPDGEKPYRVAGRCSVFCKSDCTHALNKGASKESVVAGLCDMMAQKITELLKGVKKESVLLIGGTSQNTAMVDFLSNKGLTVHVPENATAYESLGAALWALENRKPAVTERLQLFAEGQSTFSYLPDLKAYASKVTFRDAARQKAQSGDRCILGLDVGSTTTKAVLIREEDAAVLAGCYFRTNGDPVGAARICYKEILTQTDEPVSVIGLGITGSGRQIAGLHALTPAVINEIIAHAKAAAYFDPQVDTIFEIGGQDAKYTYLTNGVPSDYAMNEACSAGTGSFLEEAAKESLSITTEELGDIALQSSSPPNFNDQCAAFIGSDIKSAIQMGLEVKDIAAGLVYSICMNYVNRVKGSRAVGRKIFMQGGVCYNRAVPAAMAALLGKEIVVPPEPGLTGAFGVALEVRSRLHDGILKEQCFSLEELAKREVCYKPPFVCSGGKEKCDRKCTVNRIEIKGSVYPFGGACNKYYNLLADKQAYDLDIMDLAAYRERLVFERFGRNQKASLLPFNGKQVGINRALLTHTLFPLYHHFFTALGFEVVMGEEADSDGIEQKGAAFCYPVEIAHGTLHSLIRKKPDIYFLPHIKGLPVENGIEASVACPFVQAESYYLKTAFPLIKEKIVLNPVLDMSKGYGKAKPAFVEMGKRLGAGTGMTEKAFELAAQVQRGFHRECRRIGQRFLEELEENPDETALVLFGRPYNAFTASGNMGIPRKFASRGYRIIPLDFLPIEEEGPIKGMYWSMGQMILKASKLVKKHPQLFGAYITNFSCGPDSFLLSYFREEMGAKPSLTLELDGHTADAGLDTRIEAFLDVVKSYRERKDDSAIGGKTVSGSGAYTTAEVYMEKGKAWVRDSDGRSVPLTDPKVRLLIPSMGDAGSQLLAATLRHVCVNAAALPAPGEAELKLGRGHASCKECLPLLLTIGSLLSYLEARTDKEELLVYFMPETSGPCRFGQYSTMMKQVAAKLALRNVAMLSLTSENSYAGFGTDFALRAWQSVIISDILEEIHSAVLVLSEDRERGLAVFRQIKDDIIESAEQDSWKGLQAILRKAAGRLRRIPRKASLHETPKAALIGEIYVRRDAFSRQHLIEKLADRGILVKTAPIAEWIYYCDYIVKNKLVVRSQLKDRIRTHILQRFKIPYEKTIKQIFAASGFYEAHMLDVDTMISNVSDLVSPRLTGETILTVGAAITEIIEEVDGVIAIGPFGCMPGRIAEAVIGEALADKKLATARDRSLVQAVMSCYPTLPFLPIETDGNVFPQIIESRLEIFCMQVRRLHDSISTVKTEAMQGKDF